MIKSNRITKPLGTTRTPKWARSCLSTWSVFTTFHNNNICILRALLNTWHMFTWHKLSVLRGNMHKIIILIRFLLIQQFSIVVNDIVNRLSIWFILGAHMDHNDIYTIKFAFWDVLNETVFNVPDPSFANSLYLSFDLDSWHITWRHFLCVELSIRNKFSCY